MLPKIRVDHLIRSTGILMIAFLANKILAIGRQIVVARAFGTGAEYDAFVAAFRLPDILFLLIAGGALGTAFIPILSE
ncbi:MAG TPA: lipid II flippase MurJ, partial [Anaerolineae bacterium]|nr:lipid II flippase MurJ [Anaerolineae bacterium]